MATVLAATARAEDPIKAYHAWSAQRREALLKNSSAHGLNCASLSPYWEPCIHNEGGDRAF